MAWCVAESRCFPQEPSIGDGTRRTIVVPAAASIDVLEDPPARQELPEAFRPVRALTISGSLVGEQDSLAKVRFSKRLRAQARVTNPTTLRNHPGSVPCDSANFARN
jgi:hypothetical protein